MMLKLTSITLALTALAACAIIKQPGSIENANARPICLAAYNIDHTTVPNDSTIMFFMRDHTVWKNTLTQPCFGLALDTRGFTYAPTDPGSDTICGNLLTIRTNTTGKICQLGEFAEVSKPKH